MFGNDIFLCAKIGDTQSLLEVIDEIDPNLADEANESLLHYTVKFNSLEFARLLLMHQANPNIKNNNGDTPLMLACKMGKDSFIKLLIRFGANLDEKNEFGESALHMALLNGNIDIIKLLINERTNLDELTKSNRTIAHYAVKSGKINVLKFVLEKTNLSINEVDGLGNTLLHYACQVSNFDMVTYLIKLGASLHIRNNQGETALFTAVRYSTLNIIDFLIQEGAIADLSNMFNETVYDIARDDIKDYIDSLKFNLDYQRYFTEFPLHVAVLQSDYTYADKLLKLNVKPNKKDHFNHSALDYAMQIKDEKMIKILTNKNKASN